MNSCPITLQNVMCQTAREDNTTEVTIAVGVFSMLQMGRKNYREETPKPNYTLAWDRHLEFIQLFSSLPESNTVCGLTFFLHLYYVMFVTYDNVTDW